jgi:hypothetical protein
MTDINKRDSEIEKLAEEYEPSHDLQMAVEQGDIDGVLECVHNAFIAGASSQAPKLSEEESAYLDGWRDEVHSSSFIAIIDRLVGGGK